MINLEFVEMKKVPEIGGEKGGCKRRNKMRGNKMLKRNKTILTTGGHKRASSWSSDRSRGPYKSSSITLPQ